MVPSRLSCVYPHEEPRQSNRAAVRVSNLLLMRLLLLRRQDLHLRSGVGVVAVPKGNQWRVGRMYGEW